MCRDSSLRPVVMALWVLMEPVATATDLAEFVGAAVGFKLLLGIPLWAAGLLTAAFDLRSIHPPVDAVAEHEPSEDPAKDLARNSGSALHLVMVVPTPETLDGEHAAAGRLLPRSIAGLPELSEQHARL